MTDDLDLLRRYMNADSEATFDLPATVRRFKEAIESDDQGERNDVPRPDQIRRRLRSRPRRAVVIGGIGAAVAVVLLIVLLLPNIGQHPPLAAAAELRQIATNAASQSTPPLGTGQYLMTEERVSLFANVTSVGNTPTPNAQATVGATIKQWADENGDTCVSANTGPAQFASPANQAAWKAAGLLDRPNGQPDISCVSFAGGASTSIGLEDGAGVINVSSLPTDPSALAHQLTTGTTDISALNRVSLSQGENAGFERAAILLVGPTSGTTPAFTSALYNALSMIPGIDLLGSMTSHSGATGLGFAGDSSVGRSVIIVNPTNGALLEARNIQNPFVWNGLDASYLAPAPAPSIGTEGGTYGIKIEWLDPVGSPTVVSTRSLPAGVSFPGSTASSVTPPDSQASVSVVRDVTSIPAAVYNEVGIGGHASTHPSPPVILSDQPPLTLVGKTPAVLWDGAEYCPYCAAERWALTAALSRFGSWSNLKLIASSPTDVDPNTHSLSYYGATYSSPYVTFAAIDPSNNAPQTPSQEEQAVLNSYATPKYLPNASPGQVALPFIDIDNVALISGASYNPGLLAGLSWTTIAKDLSNPDSPVTQSIVGTANYITAAICSSTHGVPASVCDSPGVVAAAKALKLR